MNKKTSADRLQVFRKAAEAYIAAPVASFFSRTSLTPNALTWIGFVITLVAAILIGLGHPFAGGWVMLFSAVFDMFDGTLARRTGRVTRFGGILDSTLDRCSEAVILLGVIALFLYNNVTSVSGGWPDLLTAAALVASFLVSYIRSRAEAAGVDCQVGIFTRTERVIILALGLLLSGIDYVLVGALAIITLLSLVTVVQRLVHVSKKG